MENGTNFILKRLVSHKYTRNYCPTIGLKKNNFGSITILNKQKSLLKYTGDLTTLKKTI